MAGQIRVIPEQMRARAKKSRVKNQNIAQKFAI